MAQGGNSPEAMAGALYDPMIDTLVVHGTAAQMTERLRERPSFGARELLAMPILSFEDEHALGRTVAALGELAAE